MSALLIASVVPRTIGIAVLFWLLLAHFGGVESWLVYHFGFSLLLQQVFELGIAILIAFAIVSSHTMKKTIASLFIGSTALALLAQSLQSTNQIPVESPVKPLVTLVVKGTNMMVIQTQLLAITDAAGKPILGSINPSNINYINIRFVKTNGVPERTTVLVR
ncbi:MAG TPA: hypothetical protein VIK53_18740 [Verrucomicrobiae bacterium]|nr:hypothetical protein [Verrucomicrobiae bacterium]